MSSSPIVIGIDVGTSSVKVVALDVEGCELYSVEEPLEVSNPRIGWVEQNPLDWWESTRNALSRIVGKVGQREVKALGLSGQMHSPVFLDAQDEVIRPSILWSDGRTSNQCDEMSNILGTHRLQSILGNPILEGFTAPKLAWLRQEEPSCFSRIASILIAKDYIGYKLTGNKSTEPSDASGTSLMDIRHLSWSQEIIEHLDLSNIELPTILGSTDFVGTVSEIASRETGLMSGTPVISGGADNAAAAVSTGSVSSEICQISIGTSGTVLQCTTKPIIDDAFRLHCFAHCVRGTWYSMGVTLSAGNSMRWLRNNVYKSSISFADLDKEAQRTAPGSDGLIFLPYLSGERTPHNNPDARGGFIGLHNGHERGHLARSVMEGVAFSLMDSIVLVDQLVGSATQYVVTGGGAESEVWTQILSDVLGKPMQRVVNRSGPCYGAALLAAVGIGWFKNVEEGVESWVHLEEYINPQSSRGELYGDMYQTYKNLYPALLNNLV